MAVDAVEEQGMAIHCCHDAMVAVGELRRNPANPNRHPESQVRLLAKILAAQGWRVPITVSRRSGLIVRGHGRLDAALIAGCTHCPVDYQDYDSDEAELADMLADNRLSELSEIQMPPLKDLLEQLDTGAFDMDLTGYTSDAIERLMTQFYPDPTFGDNDVSQGDLDAAADKMGHLTDQHKRLIDVTCPECGASFAVDG